MIGTQLGKYSIESLLGEGGMGEVYLARDERLRRNVALKVIRKDALTSDGRARFRREALALAELQHPNVATIHDVGEDQGVDYLVMEYVDGLSLDQRLREGPLNAEELIDLGQQLADGLSAAHAKGLIHRDLKPANLRITPEGRLKILDFGLVRRETTPTDSTVAGTDLVSTGIVGTIPYMAPEQLGGSSTDPRTDIYGACAVLYELATGKRPHHDAKGPALMTAILSAKPDSPRTLRRALPDDLDALIMKGLAKEPDARYASGTELAAEFKQLRAGMSSRAARERNRAKRRRAVAIAAPVLALVALVLVDAGGIRTKVSRWLGVGPVPIRSLVVLPMEDLSPTPNPELQLGSALTFELTTTLQGIASIPRVISPRTARQFENSTADPIDIARELGVEGVVETSYQVIDDRIRVQASLIEASTGESIWAHSLQRDLDDLLALQGQLASTIAREIGAALDPREAAALAGGERIDPRAWLAYQQGLEHESLGLDTRSLRAVESFREAIRIEPEWAEAHAHLALNCAWRWGFLGNEEERDLVVEGKQALVDAIRLDPDLAAIQTARAMQEFWFNFDLPAAEAALEQARALNPADAAGLLQESTFWVLTGDFDRAIETGRRALELDPLNPVASRSLGYLYFSAGRFEDALEQHDVTREILARFPDEGEAWATANQTVWNLVKLGRFDEARRVVNEREDISIDIYDSCMISLAEGDTTAVREALRRPIWSGVWSRDWAATLQAHVGNPEPAFTSFERYYLDRNPRLWWQMNETVWPESFRADPRWTEWRRRLRLPV